MIQVSEDLKNEINKLRGRRLRARVKIDYSDANLDNTVFGLSNDESRASIIEQVYNGKEETSKKWASLDGSTKLDGTYFLSPVSRRDIERYEKGWWSNQLSKPNKEFSKFSKKLLGSNKIYNTDTYGKAQNYPEVVLFFTPRTISTISLAFDSARNEWAEDFDVELKNGQDILYKLSITGNTGFKYQQDIEAINLVDNIKLVIKKWNIAKRNAKCAELFTSISEMYEGDDLFNLSILETRDNRISGATSGQCVIELYNRDRRFDYDNTASSIYNLIREGARITPEIGDGEEWVKMGVFFAEAWDISKRSMRVTVTGLDRISLMSEKEYTKSEIITPPDDQENIINSSAQWILGEYENIEIDGDSIKLEF